MDTMDWSVLTAEQKTIQLYLQQKETLDLFLANHAITQAQYDKSLGDLTAKMGISPPMDDAEKRRRLLQRESEYLMFLDDEM